MSAIDERYEWRNPQTARRWDEGDVGANPVRGQQLDLLVDLFAEVKAGWTLDLGCGSGLVAELLLERWPQMSVCGIDRSQPMLELAEQRLERFGSRALLVEHDLAALEGARAPADCTAAISVQALHHLEAPALAAAYRWLRSRLVGGGWFFLLDRVDIPGPVYPAFRRTRDRLGMGRNSETWEQYRAEMARGGDRPLPLTDHLSLLSAAGFEAGCVDGRAERLFLACRAI